MQRTIALQPHAQPRAGRAWAAHGFPALDAAGVTEPGGCMRAVTERLVCRAATPTKRNTSIRKPTQIGFIEDLDITTNVHGAVACHEHCVHRGRSLEWARVSWRVVESARGTTLHHSGDGVRRCPVRIHPRPAAGREDPRQV